MTGEVIKSFLVGLGFDVDESSLAKFNKSVSSAAVKVTALYASIKVAAAGIAYGIAGISKGFEDLGYQYRLIAPTINKTLLLRQAMMDAYKSAGVNIIKVIQDSIKLNYSLEKTKIVFEAIYKSVAAKFFPLLTKQSDIFRKKLYENMPKIQAALESFVKIIFKALEITNELGQRVWSILLRVYDFFVRLDKATNGWSTIILAVIAAWKLLNLSFLATPLGQVLALSLAILALYDDIKTFYEGGRSLVNWGNDTVKMIVGLTSVIFGLVIAWKALVGVLYLWNNVTKIATAIQAAFDAVLLANPIGLIVAGVAALIGLLTLADKKWSIFGGHLSGFFTGIGGKVLDFIGGKAGMTVDEQKNIGAGVTGNGLINAAANVANNPVGSSGSTPAIPLGAQGAQTSNKNVNINQETNINVNGAADPHATGSSIAGHQTRVNGDMHRNLSGALQ